MHKPVTLNEQHCFRQWLCIAMSSKAPPKAWQRYQAQMTSLRPPLPSPDTSAQPIVKAPPKAWVLYLAQMTPLWPRLPSPDASALPIPLKLLSTRWPPTPSLRQYRNLQSPNSSIRPPWLPEYALPSSPPTQLGLLGTCVFPDLPQQCPLPSASKPPSSLVPPPLPPVPPPPTRTRPSLSPIRQRPPKYRRAIGPDRLRWCLENGVWKNCTPPPSLRAELKFWGNNPSLLDQMALPVCIRQAAEADHISVQRCGEQSLILRQMVLQKEIFHV